MITEITVQVFEDIEVVREKLIKQGFKIIDEFHLTDYYFSKYSTSKLKKMSYKSIIKNSFLIRDFVSKNSKTYLCYKSKKIQKDLVVGETKIRTLVDNPQNAVKIFLSAGMNNWGTMVNDAQSYIRSDMGLGLHNIEGLGVFIEYEEDETMINLITEEKISLMTRKLKSLGLNLGTDFNVKKIYMLFKKQNNLV